MSNAPLPLVTFPKHRALSWPVADRARLAAECVAMGTTLTELSDVRERCGLPRLSATEPSARRYALHLLRGARGQRALEAVRAERALLVEALAALPRDVVAHARQLLRLQRSSPKCLRLCEIAALWAQANVIRILAEQAEPVRLAA